MRELWRVLVVLVVTAVAGLGLGAGPAAADAARDHRLFVLAGFTGTTDAEYRAWVEALAQSPDGPSLHAAATRVLALGDEDVRAFVDDGTYLRAFRADERLRLARLINTATVPYVDQGVQDALDSTDPQVWSDFLTTGLAQAQLLDDRLAAARILDAITQESSPLLWQATQTALAGTPAELREFIVNGQHVARAADAANAAATPAPVVPAVPDPAAASPTSPAAPASAAVRGATGPAELAVTGVQAEVSLAVLAAATLLGGTGMVLLSRRGRTA